MECIPGYGEFLLSSILFLISKFRGYGMGFLENNPQVLESPVLPEFQLVLYRKPIFTFEYVDLALIPHMWVSWGTNRWDTLQALFDLIVQSPMNKM